MTHLGTRMLGVVLVVGLGLVAGCGRGPENPRLMNLRSQTEGPDEFAIVPYRKMEIPERLALDPGELPPPLPGGRNLADPDPEADAIAALGGRPGRIIRPVPAPEHAPLLAFAGRYGVDPEIRRRLAAEDLEWRRRHAGRLLERVARVNVYYRAYRPMMLDPYAELERWRALGVRTVAAPPEGVETPK